MPVKAALTSTDPSACGESRTIDFMEEIGNSTGAETERECEEDVASRENLPNSVTVSKIEVEDGRATSEVAFEGGEPDGLVVNVVVVEEDGSWKIDDFTDLARLDRDRFTTCKKRRNDHDRGDPYFGRAVRGACGTSKSPNPDAIRAR